MTTGIAAQTAALGILAPGGMLTADQITAQAGLGGWAARRAIGGLSAHGLIMPTRYDARWSITPRGLAALSGTAR